MFYRLKQNIGEHFPENCILTDLDLQKIHDYGIIEDFISSKIEDIYTLLLGRYVLLKVYQENAHGIEDPLTWNTQKIVVKILKLSISDDSITIYDCYTTKEYRIILIEDRLLQLPAIGKIYKDVKNNYIMPVSVHAYIGTPIICYVEMESTTKKSITYYELLELSYRHYKSYYWKKPFIKKNLYSIEVELFNQTYTQISSY